MERLTEKNWRNLDPWECCGQDHFCKRGCHDEGGCNNGCIVPKLYRRLAEMEDAEESGLLMQFPCKMGDKVDLSKREDIESDFGVVYHIDVWDHTEPYVWISIDENIVTYFPVSEFGKTIFVI